MHKYSAPPGDPLSILKLKGATLWFYNYPLSPPVGWHAGQVPQLQVTVVLLYHTVHRLKLLSGPQLEQKVHINLL